MTKPPPVNPLEIDPRWGIRVTEVMAHQLMLAEEEFITGESFDQRSDGSFLKLFPPIDRVAKKYGIPVEKLAEIAVRNNWEDHRRMFHSKVRDEVRSAQARERAVSHQEMISGVDNAIRKFIRRVDDDSIRMDTISDLDRAIRLREFLTGNAESKKETQVVMSLAEIQSRHRAGLEQSSMLTAEVAGVLDPDEAMAEIDPDLGGIVDPGESK